MKPPTAEQVKEYAQSINFDLDSEYFVDYYTARGWVLTNNVKMKNWQAAVRYWRRRDIKRQKTKLYPIKGKWCDVEDCIQPAVHTYNLGAYDQFRCSKHLPPDVAEYYQ